VCDYCRHSAEERTPKHASQSATQPVAADGRCAEGLIAQIFPRPSLLLQKHASDGVSRGSAAAANNATVLREMEMPMHAYQRC
jgi:hypothetical protein